MVVVWPDIEIQQLHSAFLSRPLKGLTRTATLMDDIAAALYIVWLDKESISLDYIVVENCLHPQELRDGVVG